MSSGCGDVLSLEDLKTAKKHQTFEAEVITGKTGGVATGADIDYATNQATGQVQKTLPAILRDAGYTPASFDFSTGGTLSATDRQVAVLWPLSAGGDGDYYYWTGALPKVIPAASTPASTGGVAPGAWRPVGDITLRVELATAGSGDLVDDSNIKVFSPVTGAVPRNQDSKNKDTVSIFDFGVPVSGDYSAMFTAANAAGVPVFVPAGFYPIASMARGGLSSEFYGPGTVKFSDGTTWSFERADQLISSSYPMRSPAAGANRKARSLVFIGDSITYGTGPGQANAYPKLILEKLRGRSHYPMCDRMPFVNMDYLTSTSGTITQGTTGALKHSVILAAGATVTIAAPFCDFVSFTYAQNNVNVTTVSVTDNWSTVVENYTTSLGTNKSAVLGLGSLRRGGPNTIVTIANTGANPFELNGVSTVHYNGDTGVLPQVIAYPGYATADFTSPDVLDAIYANTYYKDRFPAIVLALGTNDMYSGTAHVTASVFKANLDTIVSGLKTRFTSGVAISLVIPWRVASPASVIDGNEADYRAAMYAVARKYGCDVLDGTEVNFNANSSLFRSDTTHPNADGHAAIAEWMYSKLNLGAFSPDRKRISFGSGIVNATPLLAFAAVMDNKRIIFNGVLQLNNTTPSYPVTLGTIPSDVDMKPVSDKFFTVGTNNAGGSAVVRLSGSTLILLTGPSTVTYLYFDGAGYTLEY